MAAQNKAGRFKTVDLFAGPGALAEGFSSLRSDSGDPVFDIALSVEKEASAFQTLRLRSFYRQFSGHPPEDYYAYLTKEISKDELTSRFPEQWAAAEQETLQLELGTDEAHEDIDQRLDAIRDSAVADGSETILIGGPPCQAYSLVGRARNRGIAGYEAEKDHRHFLYQEYIRIVERLRPAAFVMENVKGILSSKVNGEPIFDRVLADMRAAGGAPDSYSLIPLVAGSKNRHGEFVIRAEQYGIPQKRHRVIVLGIRTDIADSLPTEIPLTPSLVPVERQSTVADVLEGLPPLRSGLSKSEDGSTQWQTAVTEAFRTAARACRNHNKFLEPVAVRLDAHAEQRQAQDTIPKRTSEEFVAASDPVLRNWLSGNHNRSLPNHATRGHMESDLARYAFATTFAEIYQHSPKARDYPEALTPNHASWTTGKFADRFRVQAWHQPSTTITSHIAKDGHYFIHPDPQQCRSLTVREAARLQTFPDDYYFEGNRTQQYVQVGNAVPPLLARQIGLVVQIFLLNSNLPTYNTPD